MQRKALLHFQALIEPAVAFTNSSLCCNFLACVHLLHHQPERVCSDKNCILHNLIQRALPLPLIILFLSIFFFSTILISRLNASHCLPIVYIPRLDHSASNPIPHDMCCLSPPILNSHTLIASISLLSSFFNPIEFHRASSKYYARFLFY